MLKIRREMGERKLRIWIQYLPAFSIFCEVFRA